MQSIDLVSEDRAFEVDKFPRIAQEQYDNIIDDILKRFKECYIVAQNRHIARDYLKEYVAIVYREFRKNCSIKEIFAYSGWAKIKGKNIYLSDSKKDNDYRCESGVYIPIVPEEKMGEIWLVDLKILDIGKKIYNSDGELNYHESWKVSLPFWLYLHIGFACKLFLDAGVEVQFIMILIGKTGSLKTTICKTFAEIFNEGSMLRFESTGVALENYMEQCLDQIMIVDDIFKKDGSNIKKFEALNRAFGDGVGRAKATGKDYKENIQYKVRGGCLVTAEHNLNSQQSSSLRYVVNEIGNNAIDTEVLSEFQKDKKLAKVEQRANKVQEAFGGWIDFLERHYDEIVMWLTTYQPPQLHLKFKRHQQMYKVFCAIAQMIIQWGRESGAINEQQAQWLFSVWQKIIADLMLRNQNVAKVAEPYQQFLMTLQQAIATGTVLIARDKEMFEKEGNRYIGFYRTDKGDVEYVMTPNKVISFVKKQLLDVGQELVADDTTIWRELMEHGISKGYNHKDGNGNKRKRYLKKVTLHDSQAEMLVISKEVLDHAIARFMIEEE